MQNYFFFLSYLLCLLTEILDAIMHGIKYQSIFKNALLNTFLEVNKRYNNIKIL